MRPWPERITTVLVDVGGVLFVPDAAAVTGALRAVGVAAEQAVVARAHYLAQREVDASRDSRRYAPAYVAALPGGDSRAAALLGRLFVDGRPAHPWRVDPAAVAALAGLAGRRWRLGIVSNSSGDLEERLAREAVCQRGDGPGVPVDVIVDSRAVGVAKPDPGIFHVAVRTLGVAPAAVLHIGDSVLLDVEPARAAGLVGVHYDPFGVCSARSEHPHVRSLREAGASGAEPTP